MIEHKDLGKFQANFRDQLREVAIPFLLQAILKNDINQVQRILDAVHGPLDHTDLIRAAMEGKTFAAGMSDQESKQKLFKQSDTLIALANSK